MPLCLVRIDDRLIHGQVSVGWVRVLSPDRIVVANDRVAGCDWEREVYLDAAPEGVEVSIFSLADTLKFLASQVSQVERILLLVSSPSDLLRLVEEGLDAKEVNVGGIHFRDGKKKFLPYLYLDSEDADCLKKLAAKSIRLEARDVPSARGVEVIPLIGQS